MRCDFSRRDRRRRFTVATLTTAIRITGAGIASGLDESFCITSVILGLDVARMRQSKMQYRPEPIVRRGDPGDTDIRDRPGMVRELLDDWQVDQAAAKVTHWLANAK
jgi:hypothetical protein